MATSPALLTPDAVRIRALADEVPAGPVVMINLLKFNQPGGLEAFGRYGEVTAPLFAKVGAKPIYAGQAGPTIATHDREHGGDWDWVILAEFPSIEAFIALAASDTYQNEAGPLRSEALARTLWMVSQPFPTAGEAD